jgi:hypothetical protein
MLSSEGGPVVHSFLLVPDSGLSIGTFDHVEEKMKKKKSG